MKTILINTVMSLSALTLFLSLSACTKNPLSASTAPSSATSQSLIQYPSLPPVFNVSASGIGDFGESGVTTPLLSEDASSMAFTSLNALTNDPLANFTATGANTYFKKFNTNQTSLVSMNTTGGAIGDQSTWSFYSLAQNGNFAAFRTWDSLAAPGVVSGQSNSIVLRNLNTGVNTLVNSNFVSGYNVLGLGQSKQNISSDGSYVIYGATDGNNPLIYRKNMNTNALQLVSSAADGVTPTSLFFAASGLYSMSANGNRISYVVNDASQISTGTGHQLVVADMTTNTRTVASITSNGDYSNGAVYNSVINQDGSVVAFETTSPNLFPSGIGSGWSIVAKNLNTGVVSLVSVDSSGNALTGMGYENSVQAISNDGRFVCFTSNTPNSLIPSSFTGMAAYVKDIKTGAIEVISKSTSGIIASADSCSISGDGRYASFGTTDGSLAGGTSTSGVSYIYLRQITTP